MTINPDPESTYVIDSGLGDVTQKLLSFQRSVCSSLQCFLATFKVGGAKARREKV